MSLDQRRLGDGAGDERPADLLPRFRASAPKIPQENLIDAIPEAIALGGWLGGALQWHFTFMWIFAGGGLLYVDLQAAVGHFRTVLFMPRDLPGVWPMARHYFFRTEAQWSGQYNPLQKLAYTSATCLGALLLFTGVFMYKPVQLSFIGVLFGGFYGARVLHFGACAACSPSSLGTSSWWRLHGWNNLQSIFHRMDSQHESHWRASDATNDDGNLLCTDGHASWAWQHSRYKGKMEMKEMKVTGCVAQGSHMGQFMLNNAMMSGDMKDMKKDDMKMKDGMKPMSYMLKGGDLKAHVGHKVEITGTMGDDKMAQGLDVQRTSMAKDKMMAAKVLTVKSVDMISATCP